MFRNTFWPRTIKPIDQFRDEMIRSAPTSRNLHRLRIAAIVVLLAILGSCSFYHHPYPVGQPSEPGYEIQIVQLDDYGSFWDSAYAEASLVKVEARSLSMTESTYVVVFIHGWHNNAAPDNENLRQFKSWLSKLSNELSQPARRAARAELTGSPEYRLIGIYMAWRGRSLPGFLDYGTMWWRKSAAEKVGEGDASEYLERLQRIYLRANAFSRYSKAPEHTPFMGLYTIGHSFGGQVLLKAVARPLEEQLVLRAPCLTKAVEPVRVPAKPELERIPIDSFGDLNILVNPALEAYQFARIDGLYKQLSYSTQQTPQLVVFSADNDVPRKSFFPIARALTSPFRPGMRNSYQGDLWGKALGELEDQQTHSLYSAAGVPDSLTDDDFKPENRQKVANYDFTSPTVFANVKLDRLPAKPTVENSPVSVVYTHDKIIDGHNGVFDPRFMDFLPPYIAFIEGKRLVQRYQRFRQLRQEGKSEAPTSSGVVTCSND
jgi:hypothetical protein